MRSRQWVIIVVVAVALAFITLLWLDVRGAGDPRLCGIECVGEEGVRVAGGD